MRTRAGWVLVGMALAVTGARADVWKSLDRDGHVLYSDRWVPGAQLVKADRARPRTAEADARKTSDEQASLAQSSQRISEQLSQEASERALRQDLAAARAAQCKQARDRYEKLMAQRHIYKPTPDGGREYLTDAEADQRRLNARRDMEQSCATQ